MSTARRKGLRVTGAARRDRRRDRRGLPARGRDGRRRRRAGGLAVGELSLTADLTSEEEVAAIYARVRAEFGRIDVLFNNAGISPTDDGSVLETGPRRLGARAGGQPAQRLPLLQARHPASAGGRRRLGDQHRLVRGGDGRGDVADLLHRVEGRRAGAVARARRRVRAQGRARQRALPRPGRHAAAAKSSTPRIPSRPLGASSMCRWAASPTPRRSPRRSSSWPATSRATSPPPLPRRRRPQRRLHDAAGIEPSRWTRSM